VTYILLDVRKIRRVLARGYFPVHVRQPVIQNRIIVPDGAQIALEVLHINGIKPDQGRVQPEIELGHLSAQDERSAVLGDQLLEAVQRAEHGDHVPVVLLLGLSKASLVHAGVDVSLHPLGDAIDLRAEMFRIQIDAGPLR
jgi:hypothetical protein